MASPYAYAMQHPHAATLAALVFMAASTTHAIPLAPDASARVLATVDTVRSSLTWSRYDHDTRIDVRAGRYQWDCSAMVAWILRRAAPGALATVDRGRPVAVDFVRAIRQAPTAHTRGAWQRIPRVAEARPGDVLAWARPRWFPSHNTGHVAVVMGIPEPSAGGVLVRVADATSVGHEADTRSVGQTGFGVGTLLITTDPSTGAGTGYGWIGRFTGPWIVPTAVVIGRPLR